jgi:hypothetical protein
VGVVAIGALRLPRATEVERMPSTEPTENGRTDEAHTAAYLAVGLLADATGEESFPTRDVEEAVDHLQQGRETAPEGSLTADRIEAALVLLEEVAEYEYAPDERDRLIRSALAELAPVAAGLDEWVPSLRTTKPGVPVFYQVPQAAADRAIARFRHRRQSVLEGDSELEHTVTLAEYLYEEIEEVPVIYVGAEPLYEYVGGRVDSLTIEPDDA